MEFSKSVFGGKDILNNADHHSLITIVGCPPGNSISMVAHWRVISPVAGSRVATTCSA
jgi:hypothetical protein